MTKSPTVELVFETKLDGFKRGMRELERNVKNSTNRISKNMTRLGKNITSAGKQMTIGLTTPILAFGVASGRSAAMFDDSLVKINSLVGVSRKQIALWREDILNIGAAVGKGPAELAEAMFFITSAGLRGSTALRTLIASAKGAAIGLGETAIVADAATSAMRAYGDGNLSAEKAVGILVGTVRDGKAAATEIAGSLGKVIPIAAALGVEFHEVGASIAAMTILGTRADEATTSLSSVLMSILKPTEGQKKAFRDMALSAEGLRTELREKGLLSVLQTLEEATEGNTAAMVRAIPNSKALKAVLALVGGNADAVRVIFQNLAKSGVGDLNKAFLAAQKSPMFLFRQAQATINASMIRFGTEILPKVVPLVKKMAAFITQMSKAFSKLSSETKNSIINFMAIVAVAGPVTIALGLMITAFGILVKAVAFVAVASVAAFAKIGLGIKVLAGKIVAFKLLVGGIPLAIGIALATAVGSFVLFGKTIIAVFKGIITGLQVFFVGAFNNLIVRPFLGAVNPLIEILQKLGAADLTKFKLPKITTDADLKEAFAKDFKDAGKIFGDESEKLKDKIAKAGDKITEKIKGIMPEGFQKLLFGDEKAGSPLDSGEEFFEKIQKQLEVLSIAGVDTGHKIGNSFQETTNILKDGLKDGIKNFQSLGDIATNILGRLKNKMIDTFIDSIFDSKSGIMGTIVGGISTIFGKAGGGDISGPTLVGERGPELFIPKSAGTIKTAADTRRMGGQQTSITQNITVATNVKNTVRAEMLQLFPILEQQLLTSVNRQFSGVRT